METKTKLTGKAILDKKFTKDVKGYNPDEVDAFLDEVIQDYAAFAASESKMRAYISSLERQLKGEETGDSALKEENAKLRADIKSLEIENASYRNKLSGIKPSDKPTAENLEYIKRINALESFIHQLGYDPSTIK